MISAPSSLPKMFIFDLHWETALLTRLEDQYLLSRWEIILPVVLYSLTSKKSSYPIAIFYDALTELQYVIDRHFTSPEFIDFSEDEKDELRHDIIRDVQLIAAKIANKTSPLTPFVFESYDIEKVKLIGKNLYVTIAEDRIH